MLQSLFSDELKLLHVVDLIFGKMFWSSTVFYVKLGEFIYQTFAS